MEGVSKSLTKKSYEKPQKTKYSLVACLVCLIFTKEAKAFCMEKTYLSATEGRPVVLGPEVAITEEVSFILWIRDDDTEIASIRHPKESAIIRNNGNGDKVNISHDGSLTINNFTVEDQGTYTVMIKQVNKSDCNHTFYVSVSEQSSCGDIRDVTGREEEEITLPLDGDGVQVKIVYWLSPSGELLAKTKPGGYIQAQSNYNRRLKTLADSSLTIMKLTTEDQGIYVANVYMNSGKRCSQKYNVIVSGVTPETANMKTVYVFSSEEQEVTLPFPELLMDQVEDVFWMKDYAQHIATTFMNESLHILDSRYQGRLNSTSDGSLIIHDLRVEDRGKYSADIHLTNKELYTEIYHLTIYRKSYYIPLGRRNITVTEGGDLNLQNDLQGIQSIDWLAPRWNRFAVTKQDGTMCIYNENYSDRLSSLKDGSITIKRVTKKDEGIYRAHMFSHNGTLLELEYQVYIQSMCSNSQKIFLLIQHDLILLSRFLFISRMVGM
ncbi:uncharacterized protein LOC120921997 [Rana temporaria]|uniref:uncharacterized protein LOC120921997 n=1 Tax=Rana temporaria TaxID=8407 RepID=UPI001AAD3270|nr:uncharacterized protein LOC120921997 [Rana temporaria]